MKHLFLMVTLQVLECDASKNAVTDNLEMTVLGLGQESHHGEEAHVGEDECEAGAEEGPAARESAHLCGG